LFQRTALFDLLQSFDKNIITFDPMDFNEFIRLALEEDIRDGDHSTLCCIPDTISDWAVLKIKEDGIIAGLDIAEKIFKYVEPGCEIIFSKKDGDAVLKGEEAFRVHAKTRTLLTTERLVLNIMQRMSGIASLTNIYAKKIDGYNTKLLDTRKTTPLFRWFQKEAVRIGGGHNHRMGLYDMIMLKDNHIDYCGGLENAIDKANEYLADKNLDLKIEVETRNLDDVKRVMIHGGVHRIMLDNFTPDQIREALKVIDKKYETEASGGIEIDTIASYAETGVDFISCGAIIHHATSMDLSLKAVK
jgi:nicotinate-nucleotide pyrophosphorylase (carboxylating)